MREFVEQRSDRRGADLGATILYGQICLHDLSNAANSRHFDERPGFYYASDDERVVIVLFDQPPGAGVIFVQAS